MLDNQLTSASCSLSLQHSITPGFFALENSEISLLFLLKKSVPILPHNNKLAKARQQGTLLLIFRHIFSISSLSQDSTASWLSN